MYTTSNDDTPVGKKSQQATPVTDRSTEGGGVGYGMYSPSNSRDRNGDMFSDLGGVVSGGGVSSREGTGIPGTSTGCVQQQPQQRRGQPGGDADTDAFEKNTMMMMEEVVQRTVKESLVPMIQRVMLKVDVLDSKVKQMQLAVEEIGKEGREGRGEVKEMMEVVKEMMEEVKGMMVKVENGVGVGEVPDVEALEAMVAERVSVSENRGEKDKLVHPMPPPASAQGSQYMPPPASAQGPQHMPPPPPVPPPVAPVVSHSMPPPPPPAQQPMVHHPHPPPPPVMAPQQGMGMHYAAHQPQSNTSTTSNHYAMSVNHIRPPPPSMPSTSYHGYTAPHELDQSHMYGSAAMERASHQRLHDEDAGQRSAAAAVPIEKVIDDISVMGFSREEVRNVLRELKAQGKPIDMNIVLDRLGAR